jgi:signal transduction histidine kinase
MPYASWSGAALSHLPHMIILRFIGGFLAFFLVLRDRWPEKLKRYLPLYWHATLLYTSSFLMSFMVLEANASWESLTNLLLGLLLLGSLVDWLSFVLLTSLGVALAAAVFALSRGISTFSVNSTKIQWAIYMYGFAMAICALFNRTNERGNLDRVNISKAAGGSMIHELRTLLVSTSFLISELKKNFLVLLHSYKLARQAKLPVERISNQKLSGFEKLLSRIDSHIKLSLSTMDVLLNHLKDEGAKTPPELCSALQCLTLTIERYPFQKQERKLIYLNLERDFYFIGHQGVLVNILFNLVRNALKQINKADKGDIQIWIETNEQNNEIHVRDTANGMTESQLSHLFQPFSSGDHQGTGLGLYFCKQEMERIEGEILCLSVDGEFAEFILIFKKVSQNETNTLLSASHNHSGR